MFSFCRFGKDL